MKLPKLKVGQRIEVLALDHTSDDEAEGWRTPEECMKSTPHVLAVTGYYVGQDKHTIKVAFAKCAGTFSTLFNIPKGTIIKIGS